MSFRRINALVIRHMYLFKRSFPRLMDIFFWPVVSILTWGFLTTYLEKINSNSVNVVSILLGAIIFWELLNRFQNAVSITFLEEVWEKNFLNIFVTPLTISEFLSATVVIALIRMCIVLFVLTTISVLAYHFTIFSFGLNLIPFLAVLLLFAFSVALFIMALILRFGTSAQIFAFALIFLIQPFGAVFYPVSALPLSVQWISWCFPSTYVFEGMRSVITSGILPSDLLWKGIALALVYVAFMLVYFYRMFANVKERGRLLKID